MRHELDLFAEPLDTPRAPTVPAPDQTPLALSPLDLAFAQHVARDMPGDQTTRTELVYHSALLVSAERAQGNSCVELSAWAGEPSPDATRPYVFPQATTWAQELLQSLRCGTPDDDEAHLLVLDGHRLYLRRFFVAERRLAAAIMRRVAQRDVQESDETTALFERLFPNAATQLDWQAVAAQAALRSNLVFVTGGPGTGKTTVAAKLLALLLQRSPALQIAVAAPTGRAAARLAEAIGGAVLREQLADIVGHHMPSAGSTLHRLLGYQPWSNRFRYHALHRLPHDVIVVDEASMVDVLMMDALFAAARDHARIIVLGDPDQLASVDTGFVLGDVARAAEVATSPLHEAVVRLRTSYRFGGQPGIGALAAAMQAGDSTLALDVLHDEQYPDVSLQASVSVNAVLSTLQEQVNAYLATSTPVEALDALSRFRVLCALRDGDTGVTGVNEAVERWLRTRGRSTSGWYDHRPVLVTANDSATNLFNGDVGTTLAVNGVPMVHFPVPGGGVRSLPPSRLPAHETAWAMTIHKSQGSEFDHVRLLLPASDSRILTRELLYTGITRAKTSVVVVASEELVRVALGRSVSRSSGLVDRLTRAEMRQTR